MIYPSILAHILSGIVLFLAFLFFIFYYSKIVSKDSYQLLGILLLFSVALGIHGISHALLESVYHYNPTRVLALGSEVSGDHRGIQKGQ